MILAELQQAFFNKLLGENNGFEDCIKQSGEIDNSQRMGIYQYAYIARLKETIETDHEILGLYLGDELFDQMVAGYIQQHPSQYRSLRLFSEALPKYLHDTSPFSDYTEIAELARFERVLLYAFDAAEAPRASLVQLQNIAQTQWPTLSFQLHPSVQLFITDTSCVEIWQAIKAGQTPPAATQQQVYWLVWRNTQRLTEFLSLSASEYQLLQDILSGNAFTELCEELSVFMPEETVSSFIVCTLLNWLDKGIISGWRISQ